MITIVIIVELCLISFCVIDTFIIIISSKLKSDDIGRIALDSKIV